MDAGIADAGPLREHGRRHRFRVRKGAGGKQTRERVGQRFSDGDVVCAAGRSDGHRGVRRAAAELESAVGTDAEDCGVAVPSHLSAALEGVLAARPLEADSANLKQVAVSPHHRAGGGIEGLVGAIAESRRRVRAV